MMNTTRNAESSAFHRIQVSTVKPRVIFSGVNLTTMGPLAVFKDALGSFAAQYSNQYEIVALVHHRGLLDITDVTYLEFPTIKSSWLKRLWFEYRTSKGISERLRPRLWLSMDNMSPAVTANIQAVYCHNGSLFYDFNLRDFWLDWKFGLFTLFYRYLYEINIGRNDHVVVQQKWVRQRFKQSYTIKNIIVAHPYLESPALTSNRSKSGNSSPYRFFYPAFPRPFKNAEVCLEASRILEQRGVAQFEFWLTFDASVNRYAKSIVDKYSDITSVRWLGVQSRDRVLDLYCDVDCLLFPSKLETWGLPITEFKATSKPILVADLPYAHETVGNYDRVAFFNVEDPEMLADLMERAATSKPVFVEARAETIEEPFAPSWSELWPLLLGHV